MRTISLLLLISCIFLCNATEQNSLTKCFHHQGALSDKVVCYFAKDPICTHHPRMPSNELESLKKVSFFLPLTRFGSPEVKRLADQLANRTGNEYQVMLKQVERPMKGIALSVQYDPEKIDFTYARFDAISAYKGLVFTFHHKDVVHELQRKSQGIARLACNEVVPPTIVIDCGHGGHDAGKVGLYDTQEKDVNLSIGFHVANQLKKKGYTVWCTRTSDTFVPLDQRTSFANQHKADLFVSIHANGATSQKAAGIETYWAPSALLKSEKPADTPHQFFGQQAQHKDTVSELLATQLHNNVLAAAQKQYDVKNRSVKKAVSQVLLGTDMPAALIELGFLSNATDARHLADKRYHKRLAYGICNGIDACIKHLKKV